MTMMCSMTPRPSATRVPPTRNTAPRPPGPCSSCILTPGRMPSMARRCIIIAAAGDIGDLGVVAGRQAGDVDCAMLTSPELLFISVLICP